MNAPHPHQTPHDRGQEPSLTLCSQCAPATFATDLQGVRDALERAGLAVAVRAQACLNCCEAPHAMALHGAGRATCIFHRVDIAEDLPDIVATVRHWLDAERGWIVDAQGCGRLRFCLRARIAAD